MDKYYVYRPLLSLIGITEGTSSHRGYNETLGYGAYTNGDVNLTSMTLAQIDDLQTKMLNHPKNKLRSSALGMYQIIRTTRRMIQKTLNIPDTALFDADMQDQMACFLLGQRGVDKWLAGRLKTNTLLNNLSKEWASLPNENDVGTYAGQRTGAKVQEVMAALAQVKKRHNEGQPKERVEVPVEVPVVPERVEKEVRNSTNWITTIFGAGGLLAAITTWLNDANGQTIAIVLGGGVVLCVAVLIGGEWIVRRVRAIRVALNGTV